MSVESLSKVHTEDVKTSRELNSLKKALAGGHAFETEEVGHSSDSSKGSESNAQQAVQPARGSERRIDLLA